MQPRYPRTMLATDLYPDLHPDVAISNLQLFEIHRSKISIHRAKADYSYPTIRLPHTFSTLAGLPTRIYQTVHDGALAFLVVVSSANGSRNTSERSKNNGACAKASVFTRRRRASLLCAYRVDRPQQFFKTIYFTLQDFFTV